MLAGTIARHLRIVLAVALLWVGGAADSQAPTTAAYSNPVIAGEYPDPSVIRVGNEYWATATSAMWEPEFPIFRSTDLVNWTQVGAVFSKPPAWAARDFWAPEISEYKGKYYVFYTARKRGGPLCVASASAAKPQGPYEDHGPLVCQKLGSIDAFATVDENGQRYVIWKEDGNSRNRPTPMWAQAMNDEGTELIGKPTELFRNDKPWEGHVVEGAFVLRRNGMFYMFYAGSACCDLQCNYAVGVARSKKLLGPWEKNSANPILVGGGQWQCPGHGSIVASPEGKEFFLFHAYQKNAFQLGRQTVLDQVVWNEDGWPSLKSGRNVGELLDVAVTTPQASGEFEDDFSQENLKAGWEWPLNRAPEIKTRVEQGKGVGVRAVNAKPGDWLGGLIAHRSTFADYMATTAVNAKELRDAAYAGLSAYGGANDSVGVAVSRGELMLWERRHGKTKIVARKEHSWPIVHVRYRTLPDVRFAFEVSGDGERWDSMQAGKGASGLAVARWDGSVRPALYVGGSAGAEGRFEYFKLAKSRNGS